MACLGLMLKLLDNDTMMNSSNDDVCCSGLLGSISSTYSSVGSVIIVVDCGCVSVYWCSNTVETSG